VTEAFSQVEIGTLRGMGFCPYLRGRPHLEDFATLYPEFSNLIGPLPWDTSTYCTVAVTLCQSDCSNRGVCIQVGGGVYRGGVYTLFSEAVYLGTTS
jgi:hypothetical protein